MPFFLVREPHPSQHLLHAFRNDIFLILGAFPPSCPHQFRRRSGFQFFRPLGMTRLKHMSAADQKPTQILDYARRIAIWLRVLTNVHQEAL